eukprot:3370575-Rhodomonas_salina.1
MFEGMINRFRYQFRLCTVNCGQQLIQYQKIDVKHRKKSKGFRRKRCTFGSPGKINGAVAHSSARLLRIQKRLNQADTASPATGDKMEAVRRPAVATVSGKHAHPDGSDDSGGPAPVEQHLRRSSRPQIHHPGLWPLGPVLLLAMITMAHSATVTNFSPKNGPVTGNLPILLVGSDLGQNDQTPRARLMGTSCVSTVWISNSSIVCKIARGVGENMPITVTMLEYLDGNIQRFNLQPPQMYSYDRPVIDANIPMNGPALPGIDAATVTIHGREFATVDMTMMASVGFTACETSRWQSSTTVLCKNSPSLDQGQNIAVSILNMKVQVDEVYSYDRSEIYRVTPFNARTIGQIELTVVGSGLGVVDLSHRARLHMAGREGGLTCLATQWKSDSSLHCLLPAAIDSYVSVAVTFNLHIQTLNNVFSFDSPVIGRISPMNLIGTGRIPMTLFGENFGREADFRSASLGDT